MNLTMKVESTSVMSFLPSDTISCDNEESLFYAIHSTDGEIDPIKPGKRYEHLITSASRSLEVSGLVLNR